MKYVSTRGQGEPLSFTGAVQAGLAADGGLYVPQTMPDLSELIPQWEGLSYPETCCQFFKHFATDIPEETLTEIIYRSYEHFDEPAIAPLRQLGSKVFVLELFHGPTLAFKDFALQLLGNLYEEQIRRTGNPINVLGATSGDTGAAAIHGLLGKEGVNIFILYPGGGVSPLQERQMTCTGADNVHAIAIKGSFDDAQAIVKDTFGDAEFRNEVGLSAVNSINLARILSQCVYYIYAWHQLPDEARDEVHFIVPTGNFGNVLAGWMAQKMGLPVSGFKVATNQNDILYRLFTSGRYEVGSVQPSFAPSMDIQVASNFERFLYYVEGCDPSKVVSVMQAMKQFGVYEFEDFDADTFSASRADDRDIVDIIKRVHKKYDFIADPHTACGFKELMPEATSIVLSTAHPAKFPDTIEEAVGQHVTHPTLEALMQRTPAQPKLDSDDCAGIKAFIRKHGNTRT